MKITKITILTLAIAAVLYILLPSPSWAEDEAAVYKAKSSALHSMQIPLGLGEFARETGSNSGVKAMGQSKLDARAAKVKKP